ncbi:MAG: hypothetical protein U0694_26870 [Anaerolineae bacterium]
MIFSIPVLIGILLVTFLLARSIPGDPLPRNLERATAERCAQFLQRNGLDQPIFTQFIIYVSHILQGDLGLDRSRYNRTISELMVERLPVTLELAFAACHLPSSLAFP